MHLIASHTDDTDTYDFNKDKYLFAVKINLPYLREITRNSKTISLLLPMVTVRVVSAVHLLKYWSKCMLSSET